ncbi:hypothetical protein N136_01779 [Leifsonia aquatica ATCC 14665]|uniref:Uncharacterized protein n=1 Tax=Leifsonia aquatica ATCC 14665 TaxID=1358026 RepID=U2T322_LEIAQ|nr:hypothetical protein N136_01779 [Leifsonia aquatica ATCC 14665]
MSALWRASPPLRGDALRAFNGARTRTLIHIGASDRACLRVSVCKDAQSEEEQR